MFTYKGTQFIIISDSGYAVKAKNKTGKIYTKPCLR